MAIFTDVFEDVTKQGRKIPTSDYHETGVHPIIDQGQSAIAGYTDETDGLFTDVPAIIFGDHTRVLKYVDTPCFLGADGVKLLKTKIANPNYKYLYYVLSNANIPNTGYNRHFKWLKEVNIPLPNVDEQQKIVDTLDKIGELITLRKEQLTKLDQLVKSRFIELFENKYNTVKIGDVFKTTSGGTPSKAHPEYYEGGTIPWLSSGEVNAGIISSVKNHITQAGVDNSSAKMVPENSVVIAMYGATAGQVGLLKIATTTNQAVCSVLPNNSYVPEYLYYAVKSKKDWMISQCAGGAQPNISQGIIRQMEIIDAPREKQEQFAAFVEQTDKSKLAIQQSLDKLELLKKSLMQEYFG